MLLLIWVATLAAANADSGHADKGSLSSQHKREADAEPGRKRGYSYHGGYRKKHRPLSYLGYGIYAHVTYGKREADPGHKRRGFHHHFFYDYNHGHKKNGRKKHNNYHVYIGPSEHAYPSDTLSYF